MVAGWWRERGKSCLEGKSISAIFWLHDFPSSLSAEMEKRNQTLQTQPAVTAEKRGWEWENMNSSFTGVILALELSGRKIIEKANQRIKIVKILR